MTQGVEIVSCFESYKLRDIEGSQTARINSAIGKLNKEGKRVINVSISQTGNQVPVYACILWEKD